MTYPSDSNWSLHVGARILNWSKGLMPVWRVAWCVPRQYFIVPFQIKQKYFAPLGGVDACHLAIPLLQWDSSNRKWISFSLFDSVGSFAILALCISWTSWCAFIETNVSIVRGMCLNNGLPGCRLGDGNKICHCTMAVYILSSMIQTFPPPLSSSSDQHTIRQGILENKESLRTGKTV